MNVLSETKKDLTFEQLFLFPMEKNKTTASEKQPPEKRPKDITNYLGSKQKLVDWIWRNTPDGVSSVLDAFSGSVVVAYMYKSKGLRVFANDHLRYSHHAARAIIENSSIRLSEREIEKLTHLQSRFANLHDSTMKAEYMRRLTEAQEENNDIIEKVKNHLNQ